jgi:hypothetical protein
MVRHRLPLRDPEERGRRGEEERTFSERCAGAQSFFLDLPTVVIIALNNLLITASSL